MVVDTAMGPFTLGASESAIHEAYFGKPAANVGFVAPVKQTVLAIVRKFSSPLFFFHVQLK